MSILGNRVIRVEDPRFLTDGGRYVADIEVDNAAHVVFVRSTVSHGVIVEIDTSAARSAPGVIAVLTAADLDVGPFSNAKSDHFRRMPLASDRVRFSGEAVAAVIAETYLEGLDAAELVFVDIDALDAVTTIDAALHSDVMLFPELGSNITDDRHADELDFSSCDMVIDMEIVNNRINAAPIEPRVAAARWEEDGRLTCWTSTQGPHPAQQSIRRVVQIPADQVHVITADVGGSFGSKATPGPEESVLGALARVVGRPVRWAETRTENLLAMGNARAQKNRVRLGGTADGRFTHYQLDITADGGAYPEAVTFLPYFTQIMATGVYDIANAACGWLAVSTNAPPTVAFRGAGRPEATAMIERSVDAFAAAAGLDPVEVRRKNMIRSSSFPFTTPMGQRYDSGDYEMALDGALARVGYDSLRAEQRSRREGGGPLVLGIGIASYVEITAPNPTPGQSEFGSVSLQPDGSVLARTGSTPYGQGHETTWAMIVAEQMGVQIERVTVLWGDTDEVPSSNITGGSRSVQLAGSAMFDATVRMIEAAKTAAASILEAAPEDMVFDRDASAFHVAGSPATNVDWDDIARDLDEPIVAVSEFGQNGATFPFGTHIAVVEVDTDTGGVKLIRLVTTDDAGTLINPLIAEGQVHGGVAAGVSQALFEEVLYDEYGNLTTANLADYALPAASEFPWFEVTLTQTPTPLNPLGAKGIGEAGSIGSTPAVHNAVIDALSHVGVRHIDLPLTPSKVWNAYAKAIAAAPE